MFIKLEGTYGAYEFHEQLYYVFEKLDRVGINSFKDIEIRAKPVIAGEEINIASSTGERIEEFCLGKADAWIWNKSFDDILVVKSKEDLSSIQRILDGERDFALEQIFRLQEKWCLSDSEFKALFQIPSAKAVKENIKTLQDRQLVVLANFLRIESWYCYLLPISDWLRDPIFINGREERPLAFMMANPTEHSAILAARYQRRERGDYIRGQSVMASHIEVETAS